MRKCVLVLSCCVGCGGGGEVSTPDATPPVDEWTDPTPMDVFSTNELIAPSLSSDGLDLYVSAWVGEFAGNFVAHRASTSSSWGPLNPTPNAAPTFQPRVSSDGLTMYAAMFNTTFPESFDVVRLTRATTADSWSSPYLVAGASSDVIDEDMPSACLDGAHIVYQTPGIDRFDFYEFDGTTNRKLDELADYKPAYPFMSESCLSLYFSSHMAGGVDRIFVSRRESPDDPWGAPEPMLELIVGGDELWTPWVSADETHIVFADFGSPGSGDNALYEAFRRM